MLDLGIALLSVVGGLALGYVFYGGLWQTLRLGLGSPLAPIALLVSFLLRTVLVLAGLFYLCGHDLRRYAFAMGGFLTARILVTVTAGARHAA